MAEKKSEKSEKSDTTYRPALETRYREQIRQALQQELGLKNVMQVPRLEKIVLNMGVGEGSRDEKILVQAEADLTMIAGQKPKRTKAKISVSAFKLREGMPVGCCVTLRGARMYDFLDRLINVAIPRVRDFRGLPLNAFDGRGNHSMGVKEQLIFTELDYNQIETIRGMNITTVTSAKTDAECRELLTLLGMPFRRS